MFSTRNLKSNVPDGDGNEIITKCRKLVCGFNHSTQLNEQLIDDQIKQNEQEPDKKNISS